MKLRSEKLTQEHLNQLRAHLQPEQAKFGEMLDQHADFAEKANLSGPCRAFVKDGRVISCAGLVNFGESGRAILWCGFVTGIAKDFVEFFRLAVKLLEREPWRRLEAHIDVEWPQAKRLAVLGGLKYEGTMRSFTIDGHDCELWARVRNEH